MTAAYTEFKGKVIVVTGAASGIGAAQAEAFLKQGALVAGIDCQSMHTMAAEYKADFLALPADVTKLEDLQQAVNQVLQHWQRIDCLLNTAGILDDYKPTLATEETLWDQVMNTNLKSVFRLTNLILPQMLEQQQGTIINMASIAGLVAGGGGAAYTTAKHGIIGYTKQLALDYAAAGIRINALAPGAVRTPMNQADFQGDGAMAQWVAEETPMKRWASAAEVAQATLFLASQQASYLQGVVLPVDGGWLLK